MNGSLIILGRGRCGTSALAGVIDRMGISFAGIKEKKFSNGVLRGYYEKEEVSDFTRKYIGSDQFKEGEPSDEFKENFKKFKGRGLKSHRLIWLIPWILKEDPETRVIYCTRDIKKQAKSINMACWNGRKDLDKIKQSIKDYDKAVKLLDIDYLEVRFEDLISDPEKEVKRVAEYLGVKPTKEAIKFIKPKYSLFGI